MKLRILILTSLLLLVNQVHALSISGGNIFAVDWFVELNPANNSVELALSGDVMNTADLRLLVLDTPREPVGPLTDDGPLVPYECVDDECPTVAESGMVGLLAIGLLAMVAGRRRFNL